MTRARCVEARRAGAMKSWSIRPSQMRCAAGRWPARIGAWRQLQMQRGRCAVGVRRGSTTISAPPFCCWSKYCMIGGMVSAALPPTSRMASASGDILQRKGQSPVQAERLDSRRRRRRHTEAPVVVDVRRAQRHTGELAEQVGLLIGQTAAAEHPDGVPPVLLLRPLGIPQAIRSSAASHVTGRSAPPLPSRISGVVSRSGCASRSAAVQPFWQRPPLLVGKSRGATVSRPLVVRHQSSCRTAARSRGSGWRCAHGVPPASRRGRHPG